MQTTRLLKRLNVMSIYKIPCAGVCNRGKIGNREVVGYGLNGSYSYLDLEDFPYPAIRFRENTLELLALKEKERGDWRRLGCDEKKMLYRASFRQTFAEINAPNSEWKNIMAWTMIGVSISLWFWIYIRIFVHPEKAPHTFSEEHRAHSYWKLVALGARPFSGIYKPPNADKYKPQDKDQNDYKDYSDGTEDTD